MPTRSIILWFSLSIALLSFGTYVVFQREHLFQPKPQSFVYDEVIKQYPIFDKEASVAKENAAQVAQELEQTANAMKDAPQTVAYARYLVARAYVNAVIANWEDQESLIKALNFSTAIIEDENGYPNLRAYTVAIVDTLLYPSVPEKVKQQVTKHTYFSRFAENTDKSISAFRFNLLNFGNNLHRMTDIKYRLAILETQRLARIQRTSPAMPAIWENVRRYMVDAEASLALDRSGEMPFKNQSYLVESLYQRAVLSAIYLETTGEKPLGDPEVLFSDATALAQNEMPKLLPIIKNSHERYRSHKSLE